MRGQITRPFFLPTFLSPLAMPNLQPEGRGAQMAWYLEVSLLMPRAEQKKAEK